MCNTRFAILSLTMYRGNKNFDLNITVITLAHKRGELVRRKKSRCDGDQIVTMLDLSLKE